MKNSFESNLIKIPANEVVDELYGKPPSKGEKDIAEFRKKKIKKPEKIKSQELFSNFSEQFKTRKKTLEQVGLLRELSTGELGIVGIDGREYPFPTVDQIIDQMEEKQELLELKRSQGFTELQIVPFALPINTFIDKYRKVILDHYQNGTLLSANGGNNLKLTKKEPIRIWGFCNNEDVTGELVYHPEQFTKENHNGKTKQEILNSDHLINGWRIILLENLPNLPTEGNSCEINGRKQFEANFSPNEYLDKLKTDPQYEGEIGLTPEDWLTYAISYLEEKNQAIDENHLSYGICCYLIGAYSTPFEEVPTGGWDIGSRQSRLDLAHPNLDPSGASVRSGVSLI